ncbi:arginyl-tRNA--protein transferase 1 isoform X2 [Anopheles stephensi]|uniref:arginyl-tRNA--protein transferase 1 isoform X2 n=1 Tax=Anopheles stephensi TaxID=30069 RepID=UPI0016587704|nr:arginyl-tRNA--protein transferase 1 isoform X2 [Anopheles stephensi]XP_035895610.1 arginyl-tRNA--protein transferase 1 isoform X2 [Anopheles stephensi]XP_035895611.1 arginyl-tRNA--protein transferase 1 isoform X2 [Anopheles stephensi]
MSFSVVEFYGQNSRYACGYCKQSNSCYSNGMWAHRLTCQDYQELIDRGWRRSGCYCYKPVMDVTCCPSYTIKCDALNFSLNKSHKKILKRLHKFLRDGKRDPTDTTGALGTSEEDSTEDNESFEHMEVPSMEPHPVDQDVMDVMELGEANPKHDRPSEHTVESESGGSNVPKHAASAIENFPKHSTESNITNQPKKAKLMRIERKREKLQKKGLSDAEIENMMKSSKGSSSSKSPKKTLEEFLAECPQESDKPAHRLKVKYIPASDGATATTFNLYSIYQQSIHNDPASKLKMDRFKRFLVKSPLKGAQGYGSFHQQYWLDDRLIAVGVIDVLPNCVSSVYFFYDPEFKFLSLGTYSSLREIAYTRSLHSKYPNIKSYYMGFYIHSCPKMRYKSNLQPSYLLCPETYTWHPLDKTVLAKLDAHKYSRLNDDAEAQDANHTTEQDVKETLVLTGRSYTTYAEYLTMVDADEDVPSMAEYARLVGKSCAKKMMLYKI